MDLLLVEHHQGKLANHIELAVTTNEWHKVITSKILHTTCLLHGAAGKLNFLCQIIKIIKCKKPCTFAAYITFCFVLKHQIFDQPLMKQIIQTTIN